MLKDVDTLVYVDSVDTINFAKTLLKEMRQSETIANTRSFQAS